MPYKTSNPRVSQNKDNTRSWWQIPNLSWSPNPSESVAPAFLQLPSYMIASYWCSKIQLNIKKCRTFLFFFNHFPMLASETYSTHMQLHHSLLPLPPGSGKGSSGFCSAPARFLKSRLEASWSSGALYFWKFSAEQIAWRQAQPRRRSKDANTWRWAPRPGAALTPQGFLWGTGKHHSLQHGPRTAPPVQGEMLLSHSRVHGGTLSGTYVRACKEPA